MKTISIKRDSFSYKLATKFSNYKTTVYSEKEEKRVPNNICAFRRALIWSSSVSILLIALSILTLVAEAHFFAYAASCVVNHIEFQPDASQWVLLGFTINSIVLVVIAVGLFVCAVVSIVNYLDNRPRKQLKPAKEPSGIQLAWESFKGKYCHPVEIQ